MLLYRDLAALLLVTLLAAIADRRRNLFWTVVGVPAGEMGYRGIVALASCPSTRSRQEVSDNRDSHDIWQKIRVYPSCHANPRPLSPTTSS